MVVCVVLLLLSSVLALPPTTKESGKSGHSVKSKNGFTLENSNSDEITENYNVDDEDYFYNISDDAMKDTPNVSESRNAETFKLSKIINEMFPKSKGQDAQESSIDKLPNIPSPKNVNSDNDSKVINEKSEDPLLQELLKCLLATISNNTSQLSPEDSQLSKDLLDVYSSKYSHNISSPHQQHADQLPSSNILQLLKNLSKINSTINENDDFGLNPKSEEEIVLSNIFQKSVENSFKNDVIGNFTIDKDGFMELLGRNNQATNLLKDFIHPINMSSTIIRNYLKENIEPPSELSPLEEVCLTIILEVLSGVPLKTVIAKNLQMILDAIENELNGDFSTDENDFPQTTEDFSHLFNGTSTVTGDTLKKYIKPAAKMNEKLADVTLSLPKEIPTDTYHLLEYSHQKPLEGSPSKEIPQSSKQPPLSNILPKMISTIIKKDDQPTNTYSSKDIIPEGVPLSNIFHILQDPLKNDLNGKHPIEKNIFMDFQRDNQAENINFPKNFIHPVNKPGINVGMINVIIRELIPEKTFSIIHNHLKEDIEPSAKLAPLKNMLLFNISELLKCPFSDESTGIAQHVKNLPLTDILQILNTSLKTKSAIDKNLPYCKKNLKTTTINLFGEVFLPSILKALNQLPKIDPTQFSESSQEAPLISDNFYVLKGLSKINPSIRPPVDKDNHFMEAAKNNQPTNTYSSVKTNPLEDPPFWNIIEVLKNLIETNSTGNIKIPIESPASNNDFTNIGTHAQPTNVHSFVKVNRLEKPFVPDIFRILKNASKTYPIRNLTVHKNNSLLSFGFKNKPDNYLSKVIQLLDTLLRTDKTIPEIKEQNIEIPIPLSPLEIDSSTPSPSTSCVYAKCPIKSARIIQSLAPSKPEEVKPAVLYGSDRGLLKLLNSNTQDSVERRIIGGELVQPGQLPFHAALYALSIYQCGSTLISAYYVLTAAHCVEDYEKEELLFTVGSQSLLEGGDTYNVADVTMHKKYTDGDYDIAVIRSAKPVKFGRNVQPIYLPSLDDPEPSPGTKVTVCGWGTTTNDDEHPNYKLHKLDMMITSRRKCRRRILASPKNITRRQLCTSALKHIGTCFGDSGGPLVANGKLIGIISWGSPCAIGDPDVYTNVKVFLPWIYEQIKTMESRNYN